MRSSRWLWIVKMKPPTGGKVLHHMSHRSTGTKSIPKLHKYHFSWTSWNKWGCQDWQSLLRTCNKASRSQARYMEEQAGCLEPTAVMNIQSHKTLSWRTTDTTPLPSCAATALTHNGRSCSRSSRQSSRRAGCLGHMRPLTGGRSRQPASATSLCSHSWSRTSAQASASAYSRQTRCGDVRTFGDRVTMPLWLSPTSPTTMTSRPSSTWPWRTLAPSNVPWCGHRTSTVPTDNSLWGTQMTATVCSWPLTGQSCWNTMQWPSERWAPFGTSTGPQTASLSWAEDCWPRRLDTTWTTSSEWSWLHRFPAGMNSSPGWHVSWVSGWKSGKPYRQLHRRRSLASVSPLTTTWWRSRHTLTAATKPGPQSRRPWMTTCSRVKPPTDWQENWSSSPLHCLDSLAKRLSNLSMPGHMDCPTMIMEISSMDHSGRRCWHLRTCWQRSNHGWYRGRCNTQQRWCTQTRSSSWTVRPFHRDQNKFPNNGTKPNAIPMRMVGAMSSTLTASHTTQQARYHPGLSSGFALGKPTSGDCSTISGIFGLPSIAIQDADVIHRQRFRILCSAERLLQGSRDLQLDRPDLESGGTAWMAPPLGMGPIRVQHQWPSFQAKLQRDGADKSILDQHWDRPSLQDPLPGCRRHRLCTRTSPTWRDEHCTTFPADSSHW